MVAGASENEIALVVFLLVVVLLATKVGKIGEVIGGLFEGRPPAGDDATASSTHDREEPRDR